MERLTQRFANGQVGVSGCGNNCKYDYKYCNNRAENCPTFDELYEKLAAYEDTGLTPEETQKYRELENRLKDIYGDHNDLVRFAVEGLEIYRLVRSKAIILTDDDVDRWNAYKLIGPVEECREAVEKQRAKKPVTYQQTNRADCPNCGNTVRGIKEPFGSWCSKCGKKLDWSE